LTDPRSTWVNVYWKLFLNLLRCLPFSQCLFYREPRGRYWTSMVLLFRRFLILLIRGNSRDTFLVIVFWHSWKKLHADIETFKFRTFRFPSLHWRRHLWFYVNPFWPTQEYFLLFQNESHFILYEISWKNPLLHVQSMSLKVNQWHFQYS